MFYIITSSCGVTALEMMLNYREWGHSPLQHADVFVRDETFDPSHFPSPPVTRGLAVKDDNLSHFERQLCWRPRHIVKESHSLYLCKHLETVNGVYSHEMAQNYSKRITIALCMRNLMDETGISIMHILNMHHTSKMKIFQLVLTASKDCLIVRKWF